MSPIVTDLKVAARRLASDRAFLTATLLTLAVCIGANVTIFSVVSSVLLEPLPFFQPDRIVALWNAYPGATPDTEKGGSNAVPDYFDRRALADAFEEVAVYRGAGRSLELEGRPERVNAWSVTPSFFPLLHAQAALGRIFEEPEGARGEDQVVVLSHALSQQLYGDSAAAIDSTLRLDGEPYTVVGVMPPGFVYVDGDVQLWTPATFGEEERYQYHSNSWQMIARLQPGVSLEQAQQEIDALNQRNMERTPELKQLLIDAGFHTPVVRLEDLLVRDVASVLYLLWGGVAFVLLVGCVNVANLMLVRSSARRRELATRLALGAQSRRLFRLLLVEGLLVSALSGATGLALGMAGLRALRGFGIEDLPFAGRIHVDSRAVALTLGLVVLVALLVTLIPMVGARSANLSLAFRQTGRTGTTGRGARLMRKGLVAGQVALSLVLLVGAGLLATSFRRLLAVDPGFDLDEVLTGSVAMTGNAYPGDDERRQFVDRALERLRALPGVEAAGVTTMIPMGSNNSDSVVLPEGYQVRPGESVISPARSAVSAGYFAAMGIQVVQGRPIDQRDAEDSPSVMVIDQRLADRYWPKGDALGKRMIRPQRPEDLLDQEHAPKSTIVGVVEPVSMHGLAESSAEIGAYYVPITQEASSFVTFALRTSVKPRSVVEPVRNALAEIDPEMPLFSIRTQRERLERSLADRKTPMLLVGIFAGAAVLLAAVGLYGMLAYQVELRRREIGIRTALGASVSRTFREVILEGISMLVPGLALGLIGAAGLRQVIVSQLYDVTPGEPSVLVPVVAMLSVVAIVASIVPARRATQVDPVVALNVE